MGIITVSTYQVTEKITWVLTIGLEPSLSCVFANTFCYNYPWLAVWIILLLSLTLLESATTLNFVGWSDQGWGLQKKPQPFIGEENRDQLHWCSRAPLSEEEIWEKAPWHGILMALWGHPSLLPHRIEGHPLPQISPSGAYKKDGLSCSTLNSFGLLLNFICMGSYSVSGISFSNKFQIHACFSINHWFVLFPSCVLFHCMSVPQLICTFYCW